MNALDKRRDIHLRVLDTSSSQSRDDSAAIYAVCTVSGASSYDAAYFHLSLGALRIQTAPALNVCYMHASMSPVLAHCSSGRGRE